ncbi:hypothetical protein AMTR_s00116p00105170 [Amborella trichopoda]|uniref:Uncharacterized protein n=1 Tax=Amborella trichopoda TaxID=13333 RepID=W1NQN9_AMBTC|nr:hypothetical protein AMTR_s00116p00105170 [Amborella trichopoda]
MGDRAVVGRDGVIEGSRGLERGESRVETGARQEKGGSWLGRVWVVHGCGGEGSVVHGLSGMRKWLGRVEGEAHGSETWRTTMGGGHATGKGGREGALGEGGREDARGEGGRATL